MRNLYESCLRAVIPGIIGMLIFCGSAAAADPVSTAAVLDLEAKEGISKGVVSTISDYLRTQLVNTNRFVIVTRENMDQILKEQNFQMSGCTSQECIVQMGQLLGVNKMFMGSIGKVGSTYVLNLKIINVENGKIEKAEAEMAYSEDQLLPATSNLAKRMAGLSAQPLAQTGAAPQPQQKAWAEPEPPGKILSQGWLGVHAGSITDKFAASFGLAAKEGALVLGVMKGSPAEKAQIKRGDVITAFNGSPVKGSVDLASLERKTVEGDKAAVKVMRGGKEIAAEAVMQKKIENEDISGLSEQFYGLSVLETGDGYLVTAVRKGTYDGNSEIEAGDMIKEVNSQNFNYISDLYAAMAAAGSSARLQMERGNTSLNVTASMIEKVGIGIYMALPTTPAGSFVPGFTMANYVPDDPGNNIELGLRFWQSQSGLTNFEFLLGYPFLFVKPVKAYNVTLFLGGNCVFTFGDVPGYTGYFGTDVGFLAKSSVEFYAGPAGFFIEGGLDIMFLGVASWEDAAGKSHKVLRPSPSVYFPVNAGVRFYF